MTQRTIAITGASGMVGSELRRQLQAQGHRVLGLTRSKEKVGKDLVFWDLKAQEIDSEGLRGVDSIVHLAGESVAQRWNADSKQRILESRRLGTRLVAAHICSLPTSERPTLISASAIGYYGVSRGSEVLDETSTSGSGFLAEVCKVWEEETKPVSDAGTRVANLRIGIVLAKEGGALSKMALPFKMGVGGKIGSGEQYFSWITLRDLVSMIIFAIENESVSGAVNAVSGAVTNSQLTKALGQAVNRPTLFSVPSFAMKIAMGTEMASEMLLGGQRVQPTVLREHGFEWADSNLAQALRRLL